MSKAAWDRLLQQPDTNNWLNDYKQMMASSNESFYNKSIVEIDPPLILIEDLFSYADKQDNNFFNILPIATRIAAQTIGLDLVSVQPISGPVGTLMYMDVVYESPLLRLFKDLKIKYIKHSMLDKPIYNTYEEALQNVKICGLRLEHVKEEFKTPELLLCAINECGASLEFISEALQTEMLCEIAVKQNGYNLLYVKQQTQEICNIAVKSYTHTSIISYVNTEFRTKDLYFKTFKQNINYINDIDIPYEIKLEYFKDNVHIFENITEKNEQLCQIAVKADGLLLEFVPAEFKTISLILTAFKQNPMAYKYI